MIMGILSKDAHQEKHRFENLGNSQIEWDVHFISHPKRKTQSCQGLNSTGDGHPTFTIGNPYSGYANLI